jgi:uncharacterized membrane protein YidH (DUF202 family)
VLRKLLICGLAAGAFAGVLATGFAEVAGEPAIDEAISFEQGQAAPAEEAHTQELVSRGVQSGVGLPSAALIYGIALGGLFALAFAAAYGRVGHASPARTALWLAAVAFVVVFLVPFIKYPATPPAVGDPETIGDRTLLYVIMVAISVLAAVAALRVRAALSRRGSPPAAVLVAGASYLLAVLVAGIVMPAVDEVPAEFPATTLWDFREASVGVQAVLWGGIGVVFAATAKRVMAGQSIVPRSFHTDS